MYTFSEISQPHLIFSVKSQQGGPNHEAEHLTQEDKPETMTKNLEIIRISLEHCVIQYLNLFRISKLDIRIFA